MLRAIRFLIKRKNFNFENFKLLEWENDCKIGLTGSIICTQIYGS